MPTGTRRSGEGGDAGGPGRLSACVGRGAAALAEGRPSGRVRDCADVDPGSGLPPRTLLRVGIWPGGVEWTVWTIHGVCAEMAAIGRRTPHRRCTSACVTHTPARDDERRAAVRGAMQAGRSRAPISRVRRTLRRQRRGPSAGAPGGRDTFDGGPVPWGHRARADCGRPARKPPVPPTPAPTTPPELQIARWRGGSDNGRSAGLLSQRTISSHLHRSSQVGITGGAAVPSQTKRTPDLRTRPVRLVPGALIHGLGCTQPHGRPGRTVEAAATSRRPRRARRAAPSRGPPNQDSVPTTEATRRRQLAKIIEGLPERPS